MSGVPSDKAVKMYVGSWAEWMDSVGVSWDDADYVDECEGCPVQLTMGDVPIPKECEDKCPFRLELD